MGAATLAMVVGIAVAHGCADYRSPTDPSGPRFSISDAVHGAGNAHFYFLPPLVGAPSPNGTAAGTYNPVVLICEWNEGMDTCDDLVAGFSRTDGTGSEVIRYDEGGEHYIVNWHTDRCITGACTLDAAKTYRIRVLVGAAELGHADVKVVSRGNELRNVDTNEFIGLLNGRTLPLKFRIEEGAIALVAPGEPVTVGAAGGAITTAGGEATLEIPAGALAGNVSITIAPATEYPDGPGEWAQPMQFGPSGTTFEEPVVLSLSFDPSKLPEGVDPRDLAIYHFDGNGWVRAGAGEINLPNQTVSAEIRHFSTYSIMIVPNTIDGESTPYIIAIGESTSVSGWAQRHETRIGATCWFEGFDWYCKVFPITYSYPSTAAVYWESSDPASVFVPISPTYPDKDGMFASPPITGASRGESLIRAYILKSEDDRVYSNGIFIRVWERLLTDDVFPPPIAPLAPRQMVTHQLALPSPRSSPVSLLLSVEGSAVVVSHTPPNGESIIVGPGETKTYEVPANEQSIPIDFIGMTGGGSTVRVWAPEYFDTATLVVDVGRGALRLDGVPATLTFGDSASVRLTLLRPDGEVGVPAVLPEGEKVLFPKGEFTVQGDLIQVRSNGWGSQAAIDPHEGEFWIRAGIIAGNGAVTATHEEYGPHKRVIAIVPPNEIGEGGKLAAGFRHTCAVRPDETVACWGTSGTATVPPVGLASVAQVAAGFGHSCALHNDGTITCWGDNPSAQAVPATAVPAVQVATGWHHTCALKASGTVVCWGENGNGQASVPELLSGAAQISAGERHTCALTATDELICWGQASFDAHVVPTGLGTLTQVATGSAHTCVLRANGTVFCWGYVSEGVTVVPAGLDDVVQIDAGWLDTCAKKADGAAVCWGASRNGQSQVPSWLPAIEQVAVGGTQVCARTVQGKVACWGALTAVPDDLAALPPDPTIEPVIKTITAGRFHSCGLTAQGQAYCWGTNDSRQLGNGSTVGSSMPIAVAGGHTFMTISAGGTHTCAITTSGEAYCWGGNFAQSVPTLMHASLRFAAITTGLTHACAVTEAGVAYCWGQGVSGRLGNGATNSSSIPVPVSTSERFVQLSASEGHTCAITIDGRAFCWGQGLNGRLGNGQADDQHSPVAVLGDHRFVSLTSGREFTCAIRTDGQTVCWGSLGESVTGSPQLLSGGYSFTKLSAYSYHICGITTSGAALCWRSNSFGQLGDGTTEGRATPTPVAGGYTFVEIDAGGQMGPLLPAHTCGLTDAGEVLCWGSNGNGQLGRGDTEDQHLPAPSIFVVASSIFFESFSGLAGGWTGTQCQTGNTVYAAASVPGWSRSGMHATHGVQWAPGRIAAALFDEGELRMNSGVQANQAGVTYRVRFLGGPMVWEICQQATGPGDGVIFDVLRADDSVLATHVYFPPPWAGAQSMALGSFTYVGDGSGPVRLRLRDNQQNVRSSGAIGDLGIWRAK